MSSQKPTTKSPPKRIELTNPTASVMEIIDAQSDRLLQNTVTKTVYAIVEDYPRKLSEVNRLTDDLNKIRRQYNEIIYKLDSYRRMYEMQKELELFFTTGAYKPKKDPEPRVDAKDLLDQDF